MSDEKRQQVVALGRLGWPLRRIEAETGIRREPASRYLRVAGIGVGGRGRRGSKPAIPRGVSTDPGSKPAIPEEVSTDRPHNFGVGGLNQNNRPVLASVRLYADWSAVKKPTGLPSDGPYAPHDVVGPQHVRNAPGNLMDVYNYGSRADALASTRIVPIVAVIPKNNVRVKCPR